MIVTHLLGGLGNQMFQYAAGLALAEHRRTILKLDPSWFRYFSEFEAHNRYALNCFNITEQFAAKQEVDYLLGRPMTTVERWSQSIASQLRFNTYADSFRRHGSYYAAKAARFDKAFWEQPDNTYLYGMWQSEQFFLPVADLLRQHFSFRYPAQPKVEDMMAKIAAAPSACVHFRRGDYLRDARFNTEIGVLPLKYYYCAVELLRARSPDVVLYIFSDEIEAIRQEFRPPGPHVFVDVVEHWHAYDEIRLMSLCNHAIISNSTFSWWGAWLNPSPNKIVIAPDPWFAGKGDGRDLVPDSWVRLPRAAES